MAAFYLRSIGSDKHTFLSANDGKNDVDTFDTLANRYTDNSPIAYASGYLSLPIYDIIGAGKVF